MVSVQKIFSCFLSKKSATNGTIQSNNIRGCTYLFVKDIPIAKWVHTCCKAHSYVEIYAPKTHLDKNVVSFSVQFVREIVQKKIDYVIFETQPWSVTI